MATKNFNIEEFLFTNPAVIKEEACKWLAERQAQKRYPKPVDIFYIKSSGDFSYKASKLTMDLFNDQELMSLLYRLEYELSFNNGQKENATRYILIDNGITRPIYTLAGIITEKEKFANRTISITVEKEVIVVDKQEYYVLEYRNKDKIETMLSTSKKTENKIVDFDSLSKDVKEAIANITFGEEAWTGTFEPFVEFTNTPNEYSDLAYITNELEELCVLAQKKRDDINFSSVKVVDTGRISKDKDKSNNAEAVAEMNAKKMAASSVVIADKMGLEGQQGATVINNVPSTSIYDNAIRTVLNTILKKTGGATDVDSKGTVQQSKGEVLMSQGDAFKADMWKANHRQNKLKELAVKNWKVHTELLKITLPFADIEEAYAIVSQEEVLSEKELIENIKAARDQKLMLGNLIGFARYNGLSLVEAYKLNKTNWEGLNDGK